ncbi:MAG: hypothetical protein ACW99U_00710 [Candidatus Thorarchaeota archaeon]
MEQETSPFFLRIYPKCPFYKSATALSIVLLLIALGTFGIYFFDLWAAVGYSVFSILFYFLVMPMTMCRYCYFKVTETTTNEERGGTTEKLLSVDEWSKSHLHMHVGQKGWAFVMAIIWFLPIILIGASLFLNFSAFALLALVGFVVVLAGNYYYMVRVKCPTCPIQEECHSSF